MKTISQLLLSLFAILLCLSCNTAHSQSLLQVVPVDADIVALADVEKITSLAEVSTADLIAALGGGSSSAIFEMLSSLVTNDTSLLHANRLWCIAATPHYEGVILAIEVNDAKGLKRYFKQQANSDNGRIVGTGYDRSAGSASKRNAPMRIRTIQQICHPERSPWQSPGGMLRKPQNQR